MSEEDNKAVVRRYFEEVWNKGDLAAADLLVAPNFSLEGCGGAISGLEAVKLYVTSYRDVYPRVHFTILSLLAEGDMVVACWLASSTNSACDASPACKRGRKTGLSVYRIASGQIAEAWASTDHLGTGPMGRLGITRNPGS